MKNTTKTYTAIFIIFLLVGSVTALPAWRNPNHILYGVERFMEGIEYWVQTSEEGKARVAMKHALKRTEEMSLVEGDPQSVLRLNADFQNHINRANSHSMSIHNVNRWMEMEQKMNLTLNHHISIMERVRERVPEQAKVAIGVAMNQSIQHRQAIIEVNRVRREQVVQVINQQGGNGGVNQGGR